VTSPWLADEFRGGNSGNQKEYAKKCVADTCRCGWRQSSELDESAPATKALGSTIASAPRMPAFGRGGNREVRPMKREELVERILDIKREKGWSWRFVTDQIGGVSPVLVVGALLGQMKLPKPLAERAASLFRLSEGEKRMLNEVPTRGGAMPPTDPLLYRLYELVMVNGPALKALIEEEFGDGIMSAIDFDLKLDRLANPKGDRVQLVMSGKFLPYKYYGAEQGVPEYGFKEE